MTAARVVVVLGYSSGDRDELHPVCAARLGRAAEVATADDVVVLSGWARVPHAVSEAELMRAAWRGSAREVVVDPDARTTVENMSIPGLVPPLSRRGRLLVDGGVLNNLPIDAMADSGEGPIVAVDVVRRLEASAVDEPPLPSIMETLSRATVLGSVERAERNRELALLVITPDTQDIPLRDFRSLDRAVEAGRAAARAALDAGAREEILAAVTAPVG